MATVYVILNESIPWHDEDSVITEILQPARYNYQDILDDLADLAREAGLLADQGATSVFLPTKGTHLASDEYYIIELEVGDRG